MTHGFERPVKVSNIIQPIKSRVGMETILFSLHHLPASKELDTAFSCIKRKKYSRYLELWKDMKVGLKKVSLGKVSLSFYV